MDNLNSKYKNHKIILASASSRRCELFKKMRIDFDNLIPDNDDESFPNSLKSEQIVRYLAKQKSEKIKGLKKNEIIITADTIVYFENKVLNKPNNFEEAYKMLNLLKGKYHQVISGVCIRSIDKTVVFDETTIVKFNYLSDHDIKYYINNYKPYDKAGSYGIQEWIGLVGIEYIKGCFYNVVGLPVQKLYKELNDFL